MTARIKSWSSRNLSFAGRITLINSVLVTIQAYWSQMMIMPKKVLKSLEAICRSFLWKGQALFHGAGVVAWENVCQPKSAGGLGIKKLEEWNKAAICKYIWAISNKQESLWLRWVHSVYIKKQEWWSFSASVHFSFYWKKMVALKDHIKNIADSAEFQRLKTKDQLVRYGIQVNERCSLCDVQNENGQHLFFECSVASQCLLEIESWLKWNARAKSLPQLVRWIGKAKISKFKKQVYAAAIAALVYSIWRTRNAVIWQENSLNSNRLIEDTKWSLKLQISIFLPKKILNVDKDWFYAL
uniref:Reverse transcriptase zinc-binding domain-containing protein n=1 Tax=Cannabis sativa TaxID=3483 RepID=A0A803P4I7_CANSA